MLFVEIFYVNPMILQADNEGPDQTARMRSLIWAFVVRIYDKAFYFMTGPKSSAVINSKTMSIAGNIIAMRSEVILLNVKIPF